MEPNQTPPADDGGMGTNPMPPVNPGGDTSVPPAGDGGTPPAQPWTPPADDGGATPPPADGAPQDGGQA